MMFKYLMESKNVQKIISEVVDLKNCKSAIILH